MSIWENVLRPIDVQKWLARLSWAIPVGLVLLAINQADVAHDILTTLRSGVPAIATVTEYERVDRAEITYGYISLIVPLPGGGVMTREKLSLPQTLMQRIEGEETLDVRVLVDGDQVVVLSMVADTQWKIAAIQAGICMFAALMALAGVVGWNRLVRRRNPDESAYAAFQAATVSRTNAS